MTKALPPKMLHVVITEPGGPAVLRVTETSLPELRPDELLIEVAAAGVNRPDVAQRQGLYPPPPGASPHPGLEVSGTVARLGVDVSGCKTGDPVCALVNGGGYAQYVKVPAGQCLPVPRGLSMLQAAALPETYFTVWANVIDRGALLAGQTFLVHGGSSGIGTTAIQLARAWGARVFATAGSEEKCEACEGLGAEIAVNYNQQDFVNVLLRATAGQGINLTLDMVAGPYLCRNIELAAANGRIVMIATLGGKKAELDVLQVLMKGLVITGSVLRPRSTAEKAAIATSLREHVWPLLENGNIQPVIHSIFPLAQAAAAHELMESSRHIGKIVLQLKSD